MSVTIVKNNAAAAIAAALKAAGEGNFKTAELGASVAQEEIRSGSKTGRTYGTHKASAPGEAPANLSGDLAGGIKPIQDGTDAGFVSEDEKSFFLNFGTNDGRIAARPFMEPAAEEIREEHVRFVAEALRAALS
jgi:phage gpG-like protein